MSTVSRCSIYLGVKQQVSSVVTVLPVLSMQEQDPDRPLLYTTKTDPTTHAHAFLAVTSLSLARQGAKNSRDFQGESSAHEVVCRCPTTH